MTRQHFAYAARLIAGLSDRAQAHVAASVCIALFRAYNPRFDEAQFLRACGL